jgi:hypothetical protein
MFLHVFFPFPETSQKPLEVVEEIFDDSTPGSIRFLGTPAWKAHIDKNTRRLERGEIDPEEKSGSRVVHNNVSQAVAEGAKTEV